MNVSMGGNKMHSHVFVVYDNQNRVVALYTNETWANRKADTSEDYRVESYVHTGNRRALEMAEWMTRDKVEEWKGI